MRDQHQRSRDPGKAADDRQFHERQGRKHAQDVCRIVAMTTREEADAVGEVLDAVRSAPAWQEAAGIVRDYLTAADGYGAAVASAFWAPEDWVTMTGILRQWFNPETSV